MAILPKVQGVQVHILVDGQRLVEYDDPDRGDAPPNSTIKYVEVEAGASFSFQISMGPQYQYKCDDLKATFYVDGSYVDNVLWSAKQYHADLFWTDTLDGVRFYKDKKWQKRPFTFAQISLGTHTSSTLYRRLLVNCRHTSLHH